MKHEMNLLPLHPPKNNGRNIPKRKGAILVFGVILVLAAIFGILFYLNLCCQNEIKKIEAEIDAKSKYQIIDANLSDQKQLLEYRTHLLESINRDRELPLQAINEILSALPDGVSVSNYIYGDNLLSISGETKRNEAIMEFKEQLHNRDFFKAINMVNTSKKPVTNTDNKNQVNEQVWEFTFDIELKEV